MTLTTTASLLATLHNSPDNLVFSDIIDVIDRHYTFSPSRFRNGELDNAAGENNGSCKVFAFARIEQLDEHATLCLFAEHHRAVLDAPDGDDHQNIRNFMRHGWDGIDMPENVLLAR